MERLQHDWLTEGLIDFEYKKYVLLAYLKDIKARFNKTQLYPFLSELIFHYNNLKKIRDHKELLFESFPKSISKADFKKLKLSYELLIKEDKTVKIIEEIITYALPHMDDAISVGKELFEFVQDNIEFEVVGVRPLYDQEGYLFINRTFSKEVNIYRYVVSTFEHTEDSYRGISTTFLECDRHGLSRTLEHIKIDLSRRFRDLPNPNIFSVVSKLKFPLPETLLPIAKRLVLQEVTAT